MDGSKRKYGRTVAYTARARPRGLPVIRTRAPALGSRPGARPTLPSVTKAKELVAPPLHGPGCARGEYYSCIIHVGGIPVEDCEGQICLIRLICPHSAQAISADLGPGGHNRTPING